MILENGAGATSERDMQILTLEAPDESEANRSLVIFDQPRDIKGTALLSFAKIREPDDP